MGLPNPYIAPDANDQIVWTLNESASPWANSGALGSLDMLIRTAGPSSVVALYSNGIQFTGAGVDRYLSTNGVGTTLGEYTAAITVSCFVKPTTFNNSNYQVLFQKAYRPDSSGSTSPYSGIELYIAPNASTTVGMLGGVITVGGVQHGVEAFVLQLNQWHHVGLTFDNSTLRLYCNGVQVGTLAQAGPIDYGTHGAWQLGGDVGSATTTAIIDDVRVANVVRPFSYFYNFGGPLQGGEVLDLPFRDSGSIIVANGELLQLGVKPFPTALSKKLNLGLDDAL